MSASASFFHFPDCDFLRAFSRLREELRSVARKGTALDQCVGGMLLVQWCCIHVLNCLKKRKVAVETQSERQCLGQWKRKARGSAWGSGNAKREAVPER